MKGDAHNENTRFNESAIRPALDADGALRGDEIRRTDGRDRPVPVPGVQPDLPIWDVVNVPPDGAGGSGDAGRNLAGSSGFPADVDGAGTVAVAVDGGQRASGNRDTRTSAANGGTVSKPNAIKKRKQNAKANAKRGKNQMPNQMPFEMPRQMPSKMPELGLITEGVELEAILQAVEIIPETAAKMTSDETRGTLWRIEQNGSGDYHWRLRFSRRRITKPVGENENVAAALAVRKGRGRHAESRAEAERFRSEVEHFENVIAAGSKRRRSGPTRKRKRKSGHRTAKRTDVPKLPRVSHGGVPVSDHYLM